jgi:site-specific DNA recombinase
MPKPPVTHPPTAVMYARVSSKEQEKEGFSIPAQLKVLRGYAEEHGFIVLQEYVDVETAKRAGRTGFTAMVDFFKKQTKTKTPEQACRIVLVEKTDRLYRNLKDWVTLDDLDLEIHFVKENVILSRDSRSSEKFIHGIKVLMAKNYIDNLSEETKKGMLEKAEQGIYPTVAPLGYRNIGGMDGKKTIEPDPDTAPLVTRLFEWYASGNYSLKEVTTMARAAGLAFRKSGTTVTKSTVHKMLTNPLYYGDFDWMGKRYQGMHTPLISKELFTRVQEVLTEKGQHRSHQQKHRWAFQGLLTCGHCGCAITAEIKKGRYVYYHCTGYKGKCPEKYVREEDIAAQFGRALEAIRLDGDVLTWMVTALKASHSDTKRYHNEMITALQKHYQKLQHRLDAMYVDKLDGTIAQAFFDQKSGEWRSEQADILRTIEQHQRANQTYVDEGVRLLELAQRATTLYERQEMREKRRLLDFVVSNSILQDGQLIPTYRKPFDMLAITNAVYHKEKAASGGADGFSEIWLPGPDSNQRPIG